MEIKKRKDSFFGLHFDFHAEPEKCKGHILGENLKEEDVRAICREIKPDFIQIDCKGHPGFTSYPSKLGNAMPEFALDTLALWRKVTKEEGVALYMHYSGVYDANYLAKNPTHGVLDKNGCYSKTDTSTFSSYVDDLLIPQFKELAAYGVDGVWVDGECWATKVDFCEKALQAYFEKTGNDVRENPPYTEDHPLYQEYRDFCREQYRIYLRHYCDEVHKEYPDFQIASNWAFSEQMPEKVTASVDFLSGDYAPENSVENVAFSSRILAAQDTPWDLMSWGFRQNFETGLHTNKHPEQLKQEAATVMMMGGGYQNYIMQRRDTSPKMNCVLQMKPVAEFVRQRENFCKGIKNVPEIVIFNSTSDHYRATPYIFGNGETYASIKGWCELLFKSGHSFEIREEHNLFENINDYPCIIIPEPRTYFEEETIEKFVNYAANGGLLIVSGVKNTKTFSEFFGIKTGEVYSGKQNNISVGDDFWSAIEQDILTLNGGDVMLFGTPTEDGEDSKMPIGVLKEFGKGKVILVGTDMGEGTRENITVTARQFVTSALSHYTPVAFVENTQYLHINIAKKDGKTLVHLLNTLGEHAVSKISSFDEIPSLSGARLRLGTDFSTATLEPCGTAVEIKRDEEGNYIDLPTIEIYSVLVLEK